MSDDTTTRRVRRILLEGAAEAYIGYPESAVGGIPVDTRCPACGIDREVCDAPHCIRWVSDDD